MTLFTLTVIEQTLAFAEYQYSVEASSAEAAVNELRENADIVAGPKHLYTDALVERDTVTRVTDSEGLEHDIPDSGTPEPSAQEKRLQELLDACRTLLACSTVNPAGEAVVDPEDLERIRAYVRLVGDPELETASERLRRKTPETLTP